MHWGTVGAISLVVYNAAPKHLTWYPLHKKCHTVTNYLYNSYFDNIKTCVWHSDLATSTVISQQEGPQFVSRLVHRVVLFLALITVYRMFCVEQGESGRIVCQEICFKTRKKCQRLDLTKHIVTHSMPKVSCIPHLLAFQNVKKIIGL